MSRITSLATAGCLALLFPALASAQVPQIGVIDLSRVARSDATDRASRALAAEGSAAVAGTDSAVAECRTGATKEPEPEDSRWKWRLRAFHYLDCVVTLVDSSLRASGTNAADTDKHGEVRLSREDLERIRMLAWWARDAAARIGQ